VLYSTARRLIWVYGHHVGKTETASVVPADFALPHADTAVLITARSLETLPMSCFDESTVPHRARLPLCH
jgi:hypothetical protein